ncbi:MAG: four helix bundle protein [Gemmataceae bacterium]|nr:four helix bundle protein [Gemmataceae bacterium]
MLRAGTSIGSNVEEAQAGETRADFIHKYAIALKEARETSYWLRILRATNLAPPECVAGLLDECEQFKRIIGAIICRAKENA